MSESVEASIIRESKELSRAYILSLTAGFMIIGNTTLLGAAVRWFPGIIPVLPGSADNAAVPFNMLVILGLALGCLVLFGATMLRYNPENRKIWGALIAVFSMPSVLTGGGFIIGFIIGIIGGAKAFSIKP